MGLLRLLVGQPSQVGSHLDHLDAWFWLDFFLFVEQLAIIIVAVCLRFSTRADNRVELS
jgi:hypothetical protein